MANDNVYAPVSSGTNSYWSWTDLPVSKEELENFEYQGTNYIYDLPPANNNLFWAGNMCSGATSIKDIDLGDRLNKSRNCRRAFNNAQFRIQSVKVQGLQMQFSSDSSVAHRDYLTGVTMPKTVSVTWLEDAYYSVTKYHQDWLCNWYDSRSDCFLIGDSGKFRQLDVVAFHYKQTKSIYDKPEVEPILLIAIRGMVPQAINGFEFSTSSSGTPIVSFEYRINSAIMFYNKALRESYSPAKEDGAAIYNDLKKNASAIWAPIIADDAKTSDENNRILHQVNSTLPSEGRLG